MEVVDTEDPVEVGTDTAFEIRITNTGSKSETNLKIVATLARAIRFSNAEGPTGFTSVGNLGGRNVHTIVFQPIKTLARANRCNLSNQRYGLVPGPQKAGT